MSGDLDAVWNAITSVRADISSHGKDLVRTVTRVEGVEKQLDATAKQFAQINKKLDALLAARNREAGLKGNVDLLMAEHQKREGSKDSGKWLAAAVSFIVSTAVGIATFISSMFDGKAP